MYFSKQEKIWTIIIIIMFASAIIYTIWEFVYDIYNPCLEYSEEYELVCSGEGTPAYDCFKKYECLKRKNN